MSSAVLVVVPTDRLGGAEGILKSLTRMAAASATSVHVVILSRGDHGFWRDLPPNVHLHFISARSEKTGVLPGTLLISRLSRQYQFDWAFSSHTHINSWLGALRLLGLLRCRHLVMRESTVVRRRFRGIKRWLIKSLYHIGYQAADLVICQTTLMRDELVTFFPRASRLNLQVLPNPLDTERARERSLANASPSPDTLRPFIISAGRMIHLKGFDVLIRAFSLVKSSFPEHKLVLLGDGEERGTYETLAKSLKVDEDVVFLGHSSNPFPYFAAADLGVISSRIEGFPNVLLEMMAVSPAVVSTLCAGDIGNIPGIVVCTPGEEGELASAMTRALQQAGPAITTELREHVETRTLEAYWKRIQSQVATASPQRQ